MTPKWVPSPNFGPRRGGAKPSLIVLHYTAMASCQAAVDRLCSHEFEVSAHYVIGRDGEVLQLVAEENRAWHAGAGRWGNCDDVNSHSIGIELDNPGNCPFSAPLMNSLENLMPRIMERWDIAAQSVIGHQDIAPRRKTDPGARFDWHRLARQGLAVWPGVAPPGDFAADMARFGYDMGPDHDPKALLAAFRDRFRPGAVGPIDRIDRAIAADLAARFPVDLGRATA